MTKKKKEQSKNHLGDLFNFSHNRNLWHFVFCIRLVNHALRPDRAVRRWNYSLGKL